MPGPLTLGEIAARLGARVAGGAQTLIEQVGSLEHAGPRQLAFYSGARYRAQLAATRAGAVVLAPQAAAETTLPRLHPADALERARQRGWMEFGSQVLNGIAALYNAPDEAALERCAAVLRERFAQVEAGEGVVSRITKIVESTRALETRAAPKAPEPAPVEPPASDRLSATVAAAHALAQRAAQRLAEAA